MKGTDMTDAEMMQKLTKVRHQLDAGAFTARDGGMHYLDLFMQVSLEQRCLLMDIVLEHQKVT
jgi:hypothetical protein